MKKALVRTIIIVASVIIVIGVVIAILAAIQNKPLYEALDGYERVEIYDLDSTQVQPELTATENATFKKALDSTSYSIMQGILEGKPGAGLTFKVDANDERVETAASDIKNIAATSTSYKLEFVYASDNTVTVEGETVTFDRAIVLIYDTVNEIQNIEVVFYDYDRVDNEIEDDEDYKVNTVLVRARTTDLYQAIAELIA